MTRAAPIDRGSRRSRVAATAVVAVGLVWTLVPLAWMALSSVKPSEQVTAATPDLLFTPTLGNYRELF
ncbi:MAG: carbohydrate ABC transporter permease, partial [Actinomadura rubrobrunea]|nr:carbohydrate ABC transporter permease [Actinomadura rubrobrunea]